MDGGWEVNILWFSIAKIYFFPRLSLGVCVSSGHCPNMSGWSTCTALWLITPMETAPAYLCFLSWSGCTETSTQAWRWLDKAVNNSDLRSLLYRSSFVLFYSALYILLSLQFLSLCCFSPSLPGWFITEGETADCSGCGGGDPFPPWSGSPAQRHKAKKCSGKFRSAVS